MASDAFDESEPKERTRIAGTDNVAKSQNESGNGEELLTYSKMHFCIPNLRPYFSLSATKTTPQIWQGPPNRRQDGPAVKPAWERA